MHLLDELSKALPDFVWLSNLDQAGNQIRLQGQSNSLTSVADFITALQAAGSDAYGCGKNNPLDRSMCWFPDVNLVSATEATNLVTFALQASFSNPEAILKQRQNATTPIPESESGGGGTSSRAALGGRRGAWLTTPIRSFRWVDSSEAALGHRRPRRRPVLVLLLVRRDHRERRQDHQAGSPQQGDPRPRSDGAEARGVPARGRGSWRRSSRRSRASCLRPRRRPT